MRLFGRTMTLVCSILWPVAALAQDVGGCNAILELATRESYNQVNSAATYRYHRDNFCSVYEQSKSGNTAVDTAGSYMQIFSGSASYSAQNAEYAYQLLCKGSTSEASGSSFLSMASNTINPGAVEAWKTCKSLYANGLRYSAVPQYDLTRGGMNKLTVTLGWAKEFKSALSIKKIIPKNMTCADGSLGEHFFAGISRTFMSAGPRILSGDSASLVCTRGFLSTPAKRTVRGKDVYIIADAASVDIETDQGTFVHDFAPALVNDLPPFDDTIERLQQAVAKLEVALKATEAKIPTYIAVVPDAGHNDWQNSNQFDFKCTDRGNRVMVAGAAGTGHHDFSTWCGTLTLKTDAKPQ